MTPFLKIVIVRFQRGEKFKYLFEKENRRSENVEAADRIKIMCFIILPFWDFSQRQVRGCKQNKLFSGPSPEGGSADHLFKTSGLNCIVSSVPNSSRNSDFR